MFSSSLRKYSRSITGVIILSLVPMAMMSTAQADILTTEEIYAQHALDEQRGKIRNLLARDEVRERLVDMGVSQADVDSRIDSMTDQEVRQLAEGIDSMPAGEGFLGFVIGLLVIFMLLDIAGATDIFPSI